MVVIHSCLGWFSKNGYCANCFFVVYNFSVSWDNYLCDSTNLSFGFFSGLLQKGGFWPCSSPCTIKANCVIILFFCNLSSTTETEKRNDDQHQVQFSFWSHHCFFLVVFILDGKNNEGRGRTRSRFIICFWKVSISYLIQVHHQIFFLYTS